MEVVDQISSGSEGTTLAMNSDIQGGWIAGFSNLDVDPQFTNPSAADFTIPATSPCKNSGENSFLPADVGDLDWDNNVGEKIPKDIGLLPRIRYMTVDMGAYECPLLEE
jgi:hypothetical protein